MKQARLGRTNIVSFYSYEVPPTGELQVKTRVKVTSSWEEEHTGTKFLSVIAKGRWKCIDVVAHTTVVALSITKLYIEK